MEKAVITKAEDVRNLGQEYIFGTRKGVIPLAAPMLNINEWRCAKPSYYAMILGKTDEELERIAYYADLVVTESKHPDFKAGQVLDDESYEKYEALLEDEKKKIILAQGAEAIEFLLRQADLQSVRSAARTVEVDAMKKLQQLYDELEDPKYDEAREILMTPIPVEMDEEGNEIEPDYTADEKKVIELRTEIDRTRGTLQETRCLINAVSYVSKNKLDRLIVKEVNLFPLVTRAILKEALEKEPYLEDDLEDLIARVVNRNERLKKLQELEAPSIILRNEKRMLQEYLDCLIANGRRGHPYKDDRTDERCPLTSLTDIVLRQTRLV